MTAPEGFTPEDAYTAASLPSMQSLTEGKVRARLREPVDDAMGQMAVGLGDGLLAGVADALRGIARAPMFGPVADAYADGQSELIGRLDLLDGVRGYCSTYQDRNVNAAWGLNNTRILPFRGAHGPYKGAHPDEAGDGGIILEEAGLWLVGAKVSARSTIFTGSNEVRVRILIYRPDGSLYSASTARDTPGTQAGTVADVTTVVVPEPGYTVRVEAWSGRWRWYDGGLAHSRLWVVKQDNRSDNPGEETVPDEEQ